jgi:uncharacterized protein
MADPSLCVYCRRQPVQHEWRPFCSERCRLLDLARWIDGEYRIAGEAASVLAPTITSDAITGDAVTDDTVMGDTLRDNPMKDDSMRDDPMGDDTSH